MSQIKPTLRMIDYCQKVSRKTGIDLPENYAVSFEVARRFLDQYALYSIGYNQSATKGNDVLQGKQKSDMPFDCTENASDKVSTHWHNLKNLLTLFFSGCLLSLLSVGLTSVFNVESDNVFSILLGLMSVFGLLIMLFVWCVFLCTLPFLSLRMTVAFFQRLNIWMCRLILVACLVIPRKLTNVDPVL